MGREGKHQLDLITFSKEVMFSPPGFFVCKITQQHPHHNYLAFQQNLGVWEGEEWATEEHINFWWGVR